MSWLSYFLVGNESQARKYCQTKEIAKYAINLFRVETRIWNPTLLVTLRQTVNDKQIDPDEAKNIPKVYGSEDAPFLWEVHDDLLEHLHRLRFADLDKLAKLWLSRDRLLSTYSDLTDKVIKSMLIDLMQASILSRHINEQVFLYIS